MLNNIFKVDRKIKIICILNIFFLSFLGVDNYMFLAEDTFNISLFIKSIFSDQILIGMYMPFLMLFYINSMYKKDSFNKLALIKIGNRETWILENIKFILKSTLFLVVIFIISIISLILLNFTKYNNIIIEYSYLLNSILFFVFMYIYLFSIGIIFLLAKLKFKKINIALIIIISIIILDTLIIRLNVNILNRFSMLYNMIYSYELGLLSLFYWILMPTFLTFILNELKDKIDLA